jgi:hypothetical protein
MQDQCEIDFNIYRELIGKEQVNGVLNIDLDPFIKQKWVPEFLDQIWLDHLKDNLHLVKKAAVTDISKNKAIILVGASPAIKRQVSELKKLNENFCLISSNGAYKFLVENGITPNYVMLVEGRDHVISDFDVQSEGTILVATPYVSPSILRNWKGEIQFCVLGGTTKYAEEIKKYFREDDLDVGGGNVIGTAMLWAYKYLSARHFIFVGTSLCYYDDYYWDGRDTSHVCDSEIFEKQPIKCVDMYGKLANITPSLCLYKTWLEAQTKYAPDAFFTNSTEDGVLGVYPKPVGRDGDFVQMEIHYIPWMNIVPLRIAINAYNLKFKEINRNGTR